MRIFYLLLVAPLTFSEYCDSGGFTCQYDGCANVIEHQWYWGDYLYRPFCYCNQCYVASTSPSYSDGPCPGKPAACPVGKYSLSGACTTCTANNYCPGDSYLPHPCSTCSGSQYRQSLCSMSVDTVCVSCPSNSITSATDPTKCTCMAGFKQTAAGPVCAACPAGQESDATRSTCVACSAGYYSLTGQPCTQCPAGSYCQYPNQAPVTCSHGFFCVAGSTSQTACTGANMYCGAGSSTVKLCPAGSFCQTTSTIEPCPAGFACAEGQYNECGYGSLCPVGSATEKDCPAGWFCQDSTVKQICPIGSMCPARSIEPVACTVKFYCPEGSATEKDCPAGWFCQDSTVKQICPAGSMCPARSIEPVACTVKSYCPEGSAAEKPCPYAYYCPAQSATPKICNGASVCLGSNSEPGLCNDPSKCITPNSDYTCPAGYLPVTDLVFFMSLSLSYNPIYQFVNYNKVRSINLYTAEMFETDITNDVFNNKYATVISGIWTGTSFNSKTPLTIGVPIVMSDSLSTAYAFAYFYRGATPVSELWEIDMQSGLSSLKKSFDWKVGAATKMSNETLLLGTGGGVYKYYITNNTMQYLFGGNEYTLSVRIVYSKDMYVIAYASKIQLVNASSYAVISTYDNQYYNIYDMEVDFNRRIAYFTAYEYLYAYYMESNSASIIKNYWIPSGEFPEYLLYAEYLSLDLLTNELHIYGMSKFTGHWEHVIFDTARYQSRVAHSLPYTLKSMSKPFPRRCAYCDLKIPGITYTDGCNFNCAAKFWKSGATCNPCTVRNCSLGMYSTQCLNDADTVCAACAPVGNMSSWTDSLCNFTCKAGFFRNDSVCLPCSNPACNPGTYKTQCNTLNDYCAECAIPSGPHTFTSGCNFSCAANTYRNNMTCSMCSFATCVAGFYRTTCAAGSVEPSKCANCTTPSGNYSWTSGCNFTCGTGYYLKNSTACATCTTPTCVPGSYVSNCTSLANRQCLNCTAPIGNYSWVSGCTFACNSGLFLASSNNCSKCTQITQCSAGYYKIPCIGDQDAACLPCNTTQCSPGKYRTSCAAGSNSDAACATCPDVLGDFDRTTECGFQCKAGNFQVDGQLMCSPCSIEPCPANFYRSVCAAGSTQDATCLPCATSCPGGQYYDACVCKNCEAPLGRFEWGQRCNFTCANDSYLAGPTECRTCSSLTCQSGQYYDNCSCLECPEVSGNFIRGNQCDITCANDSYLIGPTECRLCSSMVCEPGKYYSECSCSECHVVVGNFNWSSRCEFTCAHNSYRAGPTECKQCSNMTCPAGTSIQPCNATSDATCAPCARPGGMFSWVNGCDYVPLTTTQRMQSTSTPSIPNTTSITPVTLIASITIAKTYTEVCSNTSYYVDGICQGLHETNPDDKFTCQAQSLNGHECLNGLCTCVNNRRLLSDSCNMTLRVEHMLQEEPNITNFRPWIQEIVIVVVQPAPDMTALIIVGGLLALIVVCCCVVAIVYLAKRERPPAKPTIGNPEGSAFHGIKLL